MKNVDVKDLVGVAYREADCWEIARRAAERFGVELPEDPAEALAAPEAIGAEVSPLVEPRAGDLLLIEAREEAGRGPHIGVVLNAFQFLHGTRAGSRIDRIDHWAKRIRRRVRPFMEASRA